jgi:predicted MPP superfamily phosphohydrolase
MEKQKHYCETCRCCFDNHDTYASHVANYDHSRVILSRKRELGYNNMVAPTEANYDYVNSNHYWDNLRRDPLSEAGSVVSGVGMLEDNYGENSMP